MTLWTSQQTGNAAVNSVQDSNLSGDMSKGRLLKQFPRVLQRTSDSWTANTTSKSTLLWTPYILTSAETIYAQIKKELLAIAAACERFDTCIYGRDVITDTVESDHKPLESIVLKALSSASQHLQQMLYKMFLADTLSRAFLPKVNAYKFVHNLEEIGHNASCQRCPVASDQTRISWWSCLPGTVVSDTAWLAQEQIRCFSMSVSQLWNMRWAHSSGWTGVLRAGTGRTSLTSQGINGSDPRISHRQRGMHPVSACGLMWPYVACIRRAYDSLDWQQMTT